MQGKKQGRTFVWTLMATATVTLVPPYAVAEATSSLPDQRLQDPQPGQSRPGRARPSQDATPTTLQPADTGAQPPPNPDPGIDAPEQTAAQEPADLGEILVTAQRPRGSVIADIAPERTFNPIDIRAFGASSVEELLGSLGPQVSSSRGREDSGPVTLLNGRRISNFQEVARIPTEAIERVEIFPEELALSYGYRADQKVVNIVTFERFSSTVGQFTHAFPTRGGRDTNGTSGTRFSVRGNTRFTFGADYSASDALLESERDISQLSGMPDSGEFRTLLPTIERLAVSALASGTVLNGVSSTVNGRFEEIESEALLGPGADGGLMRDSNTRTLQFGTSQSGQRGRWLWNLTGSYNRVSTSTLTDVADLSGGRDDARSINTLANADLVLAGPLLDLPAGPLTASLRGGAGTRDFSSNSRRGGLEQTLDLSRDSGSLQASLDVPLVSRRGERSNPLGRLSANVNVELEQLSDFGGLQTFGYGLNWSPVGAISLIASVVREQGAPTLEQLAGPLIVTPDVRTFDFTRREVVDITRIFGGNPDLSADDRDVFSLGLNVKPFARRDLTISLDYITTRIENPIVSFPIATAEIEAVFPQRFTRDGQGRLLQIDGRPLNFARSSQTQLRSGFNFTRPLGTVPALPPGMQSTGARFYPSAADARRSISSDTRISVVEPGSPLARRLENMTSRVFVSLYHTWRLQDEVLLSRGGPTLDLLDGDAIDIRGGARRHQFDLEAGAFRAGLGARVSVRWQSDTILQGSGAANGDLTFSDHTTVNLNLFTNLGDRFGGRNAPGWLRSTRATVAVTNLFGSRQRVRDDAGATPVNYQAAYLDPLGRVISLSLRKVF